MDACSGRTVEYSRKTFPEGVFIPHIESTAQHSLIILLREFRPLTSELCSRRNDDEMEHDNDDDDNNQHCRKLVRNAAHAAAAAAAARKCNANANANATPPREVHRVVRELYIFTTEEGFGLQGDDMMMMMMMMKLSPTSRPTKKNQFLSGKILFFIDFSLARKQRSWGYIYIYSTYITTTTG
jgi:hypothetical protein